MHPALLLSLVSFVFACAGIGCGLVGMARSRRRLRELTYIR